MVVRVNESSDLPVTLSLDVNLWLPQKALSLWKGRKNTTPGIWPISSWSPAATRSALSSLCTSPLLYQGVLNMVKEGGILTAVDPKTGIS